MRTTFAKEINSIAQNDKRVVLLSGDIGNRMFDDLKKHCPNQFINCGRLCEKFHNVSNLEHIGLIEFYSIHNIFAVCNYCNFACLI